MKKFVSMLLAIMMVFSLATVAFAAEENGGGGSGTPPATGSITINGVSDETTYKVFRILQLESYNVTSGAYSYVVDPEWTGFVAAHPEYLATDDAGYVTWVGGDNDERVAQFAQLALQYAEDNSIDPIFVSKDDAGNTVAEFVISTNSEGKPAGKISGLDLGWYLVDSSAGALCGLTTTNPDASINAKNATPTVEKDVKEDLTGTFGATNTADIGQIVEFRSIIHVAAGAENYVLHDTMSSGLSFVHDTNNDRGVTVIEIVKSATETVPLTENTDYTVNTTDCGQGCTFHVVFTDVGMSKMDINNRVMVYYNALLNRNAVIAGEGNSNKTSLEYGDEHYTTEDETKTFTFSIDIVKTDSQNTLIDGAKFKVYDAATGGNEIAVVLLKTADESTVITDKNGNPIYRRARADETGIEIEVLDGFVTIVGFDNGTYFLEETVAPAGYNKLTSRKQFIIADGNLNATFNGDIYSSGSGVHVVNKSGSMLPETGAMGTAMFITFGMFTVLATGVLLVTKKRMSMIEE